MDKIRLERIQKSYNNIEVLKSISFNLSEGEFFCLLGPSGCGKSTLLKIISGILIPDNGNIYLNEDNINTKKPNERSINLVFQNYALFPHLNVFDNIAFGLKCKKVNYIKIKKEVEKILFSFKIEKLAKQFPNNLSGGEQQRVALARALINKPDLLLLDEPLGALDEKLKLEIQTELKKIHKEYNLTSIYVTHDQEEAFSLADRIAVLNQGKLIQVGTPKEIYYSPKTKFVADFVGEINFIYEQTNNNHLSCNYLLAIRPEDIFFVNIKTNNIISDRIMNNKNLSPKLDGIIVDKIFRGSSTEYLISNLSNDNYQKYFKVNSINLNKEIDSDIGDKVVIFWDQSKLIKIKNET